MGLQQKILIIDGHPVYSTKLTAFLEGLTFQEIKIVRKGTDALTMLCDSLPDLVLLSGSMPDADSLTILKEIKRLLPSLPVIVLVGILSDESVVQQFRSAGASDVLPRMEKDLAPLQASIVKCLLDQRV